MVLLAPHSSASPTGGSKDGNPVNLPLWQSLQNGSESHY